MIFLISTICLICRIIYSRTVYIIVRLICVYHAPIDILKSRVFYLNLSNKILLFNPLTSSLKKYVWILPKRNLCYELPVGVSHSITAANVHNIVTEFVNFFTLNGFCHKICIHIVGQKISNFEILFLDFTCDTKYLMFKYLVLLLELLFQLFSKIISLLLCCIMVF